MAAITVESSSSQGLLGLPVELRQLIYNFCALPSGIVLAPESKGRTDIHECVRTQSHKATEIERATLLSLVHVNRQIRQESYDVFGAISTLTFQKPLIFANKYLAYLQDYQIQAIRNLRLQWKDTPPVDGISGRLLPSLAVDNINCHKDLTDFARLWQNYPEFVLFVDRIEFSLPESRHKELGTGCCGPITGLMTGLTWFMYGMINVAKRQEAKGGPARYFLVEVSSPANTGIKIIIRHSPRDLWDQIEDFSDIHNIDCPQCRTVPTWRLPHREHDAPFESVAGVQEAVQAGKMYADPMDETLPALEKFSRWKLFFHPRNARKGAWICIAKQSRKRQAHEEESHTKKRKRGRRLAKEI